jgi:predicted Zn-dependent protease
VLVAGCGGQSATQTDTATQTDRPTATSTATPTSTPTATSTPTPTALPTPTLAPPDNPWGKTPITVAIDDSAVDESVRAQLSTALAYWESNADDTEYTDLSFEIIEDTERADVVVEVTEDLRVCGSRLEPESVGCAPYPGSDGFDSQATIYMEAGYTPESRVTILKHEFGHTLSLTHGMDLEIMNPELSLTNLPQTNAVDKANPWEQDTIRIYVDDSAVPQPIRDDHERYVKHAIGYYQDGAEGFTPDNVTLERVESAEDADITVSFGDRSDIGDSDQVSNGSVYGSDSDNDGRLEVFTEAEIQLAYNVEGEYGITSYNLGYWIGYSFAAPPADHAPPWERDDITYTDHWWDRA